MTRGQLKLRVSRTLGIALGTSDDAVDETALLEELANEAIIDILSRTRVHVRRGTASLTAGSVDFDVDDSVLRMVGLRRGLTQPGTLLSEQPREELTNGFAFAGLSRLTFATPAAAGESISFWYTPRPSPMTDDANDPSVQIYGRIPAEHHRAILDYMLWHAADKTGDQETSRGERYRVLYEGQDGLGNLGSDLGRIKTAVNVRGGVAMVTRARPVLTGERNDGYWVG